MWEESIFMDSKYVEKSKNQYDYVIIRVYSDKKHGVIVNKQLLQNLTIITIWIPKWEKL